MTSVKLDIVIPESHRGQLTLPSELPAGPAEVIVKTPSRSETSAPAQATPSEPRSLADLFAGRVGLVDSGGREALSQDGGEKLADHLEAKRREGHRIGATTAFEVVP